MVYVQGGTARFDQRVACSDFVLTARLSRIAEDERRFDEVFAQVNQVLAYLQGVESAKTQVDFNPSQILFHEQHGFLTNFELDKIVESEKNKGILRILKESTDEQDKKIMRMTPQVVSKDKSLGLAKVNRKLKDIVQQKALLVVTK